MQKKRIKSVPAVDEQTTLTADSEVLRVMQLSIDHAPESVLWLGPDSRVLYANETAATQLGLSRAAVNGMLLAEFEPEMTVDVWKLHWNDLKQRGAFTYESAYRRRDGTQFPVEVSVQYFRYGEREYQCAFARDISDRRSLEAQLMQSQRLESVGRLAGGMAHDFNNLLTIINGYSDMLLEVMSETDASRHELEEIRRAGKQAAALTQQLLAFSRRQVLQPRVFDLNRVITDLEVMLRRLIGEDVLLAIRLGGSPLRLKADSAKIEQVIMNLVVNARDAMPHGGRLGIETVAVDLDEEYAFRHPEVTPGPYVLLAISDTGMGMSREVKAHLFEPFFTTKAKGQGTGLGLSTAYGVVMQSGGHIAVQSEEGHGTSFKIYLPRVTEEGAVEAAQEPVTSGAGRGTETVLVAEDEDGVRNLVSNMLRMRGYTVLEARNGLEALQIVERAQSRVDLVLTDVIMPNLSGRELADRLAVLQPDTPLIYMSGYTNETVVQHGILDSGRPFLQKPFSAATLTQLIRHVLDSGDQQAT